MNIEKAINQPKFEDSYQKVMINLTYTGNWLRDKQTQLFKDFDILPQHFNILRILKGKKPHPVSPGEIKDVMLDKGNDLTRLMDKLVKMGLVKREICEINRRKIDIVITESGLQFLSNLEKPLKDLADKFKTQLSQGDAETLSNLLDKLRF